MLKSLAGIVVLIACCYALLVTAPQPRVRSVDPKPVGIAVRYAGPPADAPPHAGDIWITLPDGTERQLTTDGGSKLQPRFSPARRLIAYCAQQFAQPEKLSQSPSSSGASSGAKPSKVLRQSIRVIDLDGRLLFDQQFLDTTGANPHCSGFHNLHWIDDRRLAVLCSLDADNDEYMVMDVALGRQIASYKISCCDVSWSPDRTRMAYFGFSPATGTSAEVPSQRLEIDGQEVFPGPLHRHRGLIHSFFSVPEWAPDNTRVALLDQVHPGDRQWLVIAGEGLQPVVAPLPVELEIYEDTDSLSSEAELSWDDADTVRLTVGEDSWTADAATGEWTTPRTPTVTI